MKVYVLEIQSPSGSFVDGVYTKPKHARHHVDDMLGYSTKNHWKKCEDASRRFEAGNGAFVVTEWPVLGKESHEH